MPIKVKDNLPAKGILRGESIFVMGENRAFHQDIRPLKILIVNLMPNKQQTEVQILRLLSNTPLQLQVTFIRMESHISKHTSEAYLDEFYSVFDDIRDTRFDGMIITGAPVEQMPYEEVNYWSELCEIMEWSKTNVTSTFHICWGAQAGLYYHYGIPKYQLDKKMFGVFEHTKVYNHYDLLRGFDDVFYAPHSRYTEVNREEVLSNPVFKVLADSREAGLYLVVAEDGKNVFVMGHPEYDRFALDGEYRRDLYSRLKPSIPVHYYPDNNPAKRPRMQWRSHANALYTNWINYYVYQVTPYILDE